MVISSRATRMLISRLSQRRIASPLLLEMVTPPVSTLRAAAWLRSSLLARCAWRRLVSGLVAIQVFPADELPARVARATFLCPRDCRRDRGAAADRVPRPSVDRAELDREDQLPGRRRRHRERCELSV